MTNMILATFWSLHWKQFGPTPRHCYQLIFSTEHIPSLWGKAAISFNYNVQPSAGQNEAGDDRLTSCRTLRCRASYAWGLETMCSCSSGYLMCGGWWRSRMLATDSRNLGLAFIPDTSRQHQTTAGISRRLFSVTTCKDTSFHRCSCLFGSLVYLRFASFFV